MLTFDTYIMYTNTCDVMRKQKFVVNENTHTHTHTDCLLLFNRIHARIYNFENRLLSCERCTWGKCSSSQEYAVTLRTMMKLFFFFFFSYVLSNGRLLIFLGLWEIFFLLLLFCFCFCFAVMACTVSRWCVYIVLWAVRTNKLNTTTILVWIDFNSVSKL